MPACFLQDLSYLISPFPADADEYGSRVNTDIPGGISAGSLRATTQTRLGGQLTLMQQFGG